MSAQKITATKSSSLVRVEFVAEKEMKEYKYSPPRRKSYLFGLVSRMVPARWTMTLGKWKFDYEPKEFEKREESNGRILRWEFDGPAIYLPSKVILHFKGGIVETVEFSEEEDARETFSKLQMWLWNTLSVMDGVLYVVKENTYKRL